MDATRLAVAWFGRLSVLVNAVNSAKMAEPVEMLFGGRFK